MSTCKCTGVVKECVDQRQLVGPASLPSTLPFRHIAGSSLVYICVLPCRLYKLTKFFSGQSGGLELAGPLMVAEDGKNKVQSFQDNLPLITAICNPGLRERHWGVLAEVVGFEIKRDEVRPGRSCSGLNILDLLACPERTFRDGGLMGLWEWQHALFISLCQGTASGEITLPTNSRMSSNWEARSLSCLFARVCAVYRY